MHNFRTWSTKKTTYMKYISPTHTLLCGKMLWGRTASSSILKVPSDSLLFQSTLKSPHCSEEKQNCMPSPPSYWLTRTAFPFYISFSFIYSIDRWEELLERTPMQAKKPINITGEEINRSVCLLLWWKSHCPWHTLIIYFKTSSFPHTSLTWTCAWEGCKDTILFWFFVFYH